MWEKLLAEKLRAIRPDEEALPPDKSAAVLVLFSPPPRGGPGHLVLTKRTSTVESHKGQMSFPGGYREEKDKNWLETALREAQEEIGIQMEQVRVLGCLEKVLTKGAITIVPFVGILEPGQQFILNPAEVEKIMLLPIEFLLERGLQPVCVQEGAYSVQSVGIEWEGELIWGATARMLEQIYQIFSQNLKEVS